MLGTPFDQIHRCDMSPLATGLGKNKLLQSNAAEPPSLGTPEAGAPGTATLPAAVPRQRMLPGPQLVPVRSAQKLIPACVGPSPPHAKQGQPLPGAGTQQGIPARGCGSSQPLCSGRAI